MISVRKAIERGRGEHGWLNSRHTFSFADYHDPRQMGFRTLRVINDDRVSPAEGFGTHPHRDMEIFSYVLEGQLEHRDSLGNGKVLRPGEVQLMSAGTGVFHSEFNPSKDQHVHFLQVWIQPRQRGLPPTYSEWKPRPHQASEPKVLVISPDGRDDSAIIHQDAEVYRVRLSPGQSARHELKSGRAAWLQIASGTATLNGVALATGDGASTEDSAALVISATTATEAILFDLG